MTNETKRRQVVKFHSSKKKRTSHGTMRCVPDGSVSPCGVPLTNNRRKCQLWDCYSYAHAVEPPSRVLLLVAFLSAPGSASRNDFLLSHRQSDSRTERRRTLLFCFFDSSPRSWITHSFLEKDKLFKTEVRFPFHLYLWKLSPITCLRSRLSALRPRSSSHIYEDMFI